MDDESIFGEVIQRQTIAERNQYLVKACGQDIQQRHRIQELLVSHDQVAADTFLNDPAVSSFVPDESNLEKLGTVIGPYKIREQLGEGGMGVVYAAEQEQPVCRKVALKIIKPGMDSREVIARFEAERQALAMMDHQNIARVLDAGTTESGLPYFVMELVRGVTVTEYCDKNSLPIRKRLELFAQICKAVQHAHQKGIIHRDIKPSNVMITLHDGVPVPKVIDFGVAKAINQRLTEGTVYTKFAQMLGTPAYMSPEQAELSGLDIDTRSDIYSLGVLLYELLTGSTPFTKEELSNVSFDEMRRVIRETDPQRPSERVSTLQAEAISTVANQRSNDPRKLSNLLRGELDWIVMKALEKDRTRRYETANGFALDVQRYLDGESVLAAPPSTSYRLRKFVRRNKVGLGAACLVVVTLLFTISGLLISNNMINRREQDKQKALIQSDTNLKLARQNEKKATEAEENAKNQAAIALAVQDFVNRKILAQANPRKLKRGITLIEVIDMAGKKVGSEFPGQPLVEAEIRETLCEAYFGLNEHEKALFHVRKATELRQSHLGEFDAKTLSAKAWLVYLEQGWIRDHDVRVTNLEQLVETLEEHLGKNHKVTQRAMNHLALTYFLGSDEAGRIWRWLADNSADPELKFKAMLNLGHHKMQRGEFKDGIQLYKAVCEKGKTVLGEDDFIVVLALDSLGSESLALGDLKNGLPPMKKAWEKLRSMLGPADPFTLRAQTGLGWGYTRLGQLEDAEQYIIGVLQSPGFFSLPLADKVTVYANLSTIYDRQGRFCEAEITARDGIATVVASRTEKDSKTTHVMLLRNGVAQVLGDASRYDEQCQFLGASIEMHDRYLPVDPDSRTRVLVYDLLLLSIALTHLDRHDEAAKVLSRLLELNDRLIEIAPSYAKTTFALIRCETLARLGEHERAASEVEKLFANNQIITSRLDYDFQWQSSRWTHSASVLALCSHMARADQTLAENEQDSLSQDYASRAIGYLKIAVNNHDSLTADDLHCVSNSEDFQPLSDREDFQLLVDEMKSIVEAKKSQLARSSAEVINETEEDSRLAIEAEPENADLSWARSHGYLQQHNWQGTIDDATTAIELDPNASHYFRRGWMRFSGNDFDGAISDYTQSIRLEPDHWSSYDHRGWAYYYKQQFELALQDANYVLEKRAWNAPYLLGHIHLAQGANEHAIDDFQRATEALPEACWGHQMKGLAQLRAGKIEQAAATLDRAVEIAMSLDDRIGAFWCYFSRASLNMEQGMRDQALADFDEAKKAFDETLALEPPIDTYEALTIAITNGYLGNQEQARQHYATAVELIKRWPIDKNQDLLRLRDEAESLLESFSTAEENKSDD